MGRSTAVILPGRFLLTIGHFVVTVMAFGSVSAAAGASVAAADAAGFSAAKASATAALSLSLISFLVQFAGLFSGLTMFADGANLALAVLNFFGGTLLAWALVDAWATPAYWGIVVPFSLLPGAIEALSAAGHVVSRRAKL